jgi:FG-GAP-like repeat/Bacterial Ig domain
VDWNNDGKQDLLIVDASRKIYTAINSSATVPQYQALEHILTLHGTEISAVFVVDWNSDGKKDLIAGGYKNYTDQTGYLRYALNTGTDQAPAFANGFQIIGGTKEDWGWRTCPLALDWDGDGKKDLVVSDFKGTVKFWKNIGSDASPEFGSGVFVSTPVGNLDWGVETRLALHDYDGDGRRDLLVTNRGGSASNPGTIRLYTRNHPPQVSIQSPTTAAVGQAVSISALTSDPEGDVCQFTWKVTGKSQDSSATITGTQYGMATFVADVTGQYQVEVSVGDGHGSPAVASFSITVPKGPGDIWIDGSIDSIDLFYFASQWHQDETDFALNPNGTVDAGDLLLLIKSM